MKSPIALRVSVAVTSLLAAGSLLLAGCSVTQAQTATPIVVPRPVELSAGGTAVLNYTPWYIHTCEIEGPPGSGIHGGGPNVMPMHEDGSPSGGAKETCC